MFKPTIGRVVWYWPTAYDLAQGMFAYPGSDQPMAATVSFVHSDRMVNLSVVDHNGQAFEKRSTTLLQDGDVVRDRAGYAEWMPYQKEQATKASGCTCGTKSGCTSCGGPAASITVPPSADMAIEQEIQAKGLTAPRITPDDLKGNIVSEHYFTAYQGDAKAVEDAAFSGGSIMDAAASRPTPDSLRLLTFCVLVLRNGFTVTGESACASPENFDADIGRKIARDNAVAKIWPLMGYELRSRLHNAKEGLEQLEP